MHAFGDERLPKSIEPTRTSAHRSVCLPAVVVRCIERLRHQKRFAVGWFRLTPEEVDQQQAKVVSQAWFPPDGFKFLVIVVRSHPPEVVEAHPQFRSEEKRTLSVQDIARQLALAASESAGEHMLEHRLVGESNAALPSDEHSRRLKDMDVIQSVLELDKCEPQAFLPRHGTGNIGCEAGAARAAIRSQNPRSPEVLEHFLVAAERIQRIRTLEVQIGRERLRTAHDLLSILGPTGSENAPRLQQGADLLPWRQLEREFLRGDRSQSNIVLKFERPRRQDNMNALDSADSANQAQQNAQAFGL